MTLGEEVRNVILRGPGFPEPVQVILATPIGTSYNLVERDLHAQP
ncbi:MAG TPA: hypothetical protein VLA19_13815 [Herpetosiphonaceae bacterium]|nr:hypothetical protein [Herpetosiphonaceae bacterium]